MRTEGATTGDGTLASGLAQFGRVHIRPAYHDAAVLLIDAIRSGYFQLGEKLPSERELAHELGVSLPVVREALDVLEQAGIVDVRRGRGGGTTLVSLSGITALLSELQPDPPEALDELIVVRRLIEIESCRLAAVNASAEQLQALRELVAEAGETLDDMETFTELTVRFHIRVAVLSRNATLAELMRLVANRMAVAGLRAGVRPDRAALRRVHGLMGDLVDAMAARDDEAIAALVAQHLDTVHSQLPGRRR